MAELKPCPFCGSKKTYRRPDIDRAIGTSFSIICEVCGAMGPFAERAEKAIDAWNKRS